MERWLDGSTRGAPDLALIGGPVITLDPAGSAGQAIAVAGGRVQAVGSASEIAALVTGQTRVVDLDGRSVIPGLVDCHVHLATDAATRSSVDVRDLFEPVGSVPDIVERMRDRAASSAPGEWIAARGSPMQAHRLAEQRLPTRAELDAALPEHPAYVTFGAHILIANSRAIRERGVGPSTPDPDRGVIERDVETGEPTGVFLERAAVLIKGQTGAISFDGLQESIRLEILRCLERGVTTIHDVVADPSEVRAYQALWRSGLLPIRVGLIIRVVHSGFRDHPPLGLGLLPGFGDDRLWFCGVKVSVDGGFTGGNAAFSSEMGDDGRSGLLRITQPELDELVDRYDGAGIRMSIHAMGDVALDMALEAFGRRAQGGSLHPMRHRIEHMGNWLCSTSRLTEARRLGIVPVPNPSMQYHLPDEIRADLGEARAATAFQFQSLVDAGLPLVFGSDGPGYWPIDPLRDIGVAASRSTRTGTAVGEATTVAVRSALIAQTRTSAWLGFREADLGSLAPGKRADLAVLAADPATVTPEDIGRIAVDMTVVEGRIAFERGG